MKWILLVCLSFILLVVSSAAADEEKKRLIQFNERDKVWLPESIVEKLITDPEVHFMDVTDFEYAEKYVQAVNADPIPTSLQYTQYPFLTSIPLFLPLQVISLSFHSLACCFDGDQVREGPPSPN
jgi:hypothetical protein